MSVPINYPLYNYHPKQLLKQASPKFYCGLDWGRFDRVLSSICSTLSLFVPFLHIFRSYVVGWNRDHLCVTTHLSLTPPILSLRSEKKKRNLATITNHVLPALWTWNIAPRLHKLSVTSGLLGNRSKTKPKPAPANETGRTGPQTFPNCQGFSGIEFCAESRRSGSGGALLMGANRWLFNMIGRRYKLGVENWSRYSLIVRLVLWITTSSNWIEWLSR